MFVTSLVTPDFLYMEKNTQNIWFYVPEMENVAPTHVLLFYC